MVTKDPRSILILQAVDTRFEPDKASLCANALLMNRIISLFIESVSIPSFSKYIDVPFSFSIRIFSIHSKEFLAKRVTLLT